MKNPLIFPGHIIATILLLSATLAAMKLCSERTPNPLERPLDAINRTLAGFSSIDNPPLDPRTFQTLHATSYLMRTYTAGNSHADLFIAFYAQQRAGESMHSPKNCLPGAGWEIWKYGRAQIPIQSRIVEVNQYSISREGERNVVFYWYQSKNRIIASEYLGKLLLASDTLLHRGTSAAIARIIVPDTPATIRDGMALTAEVIPQLQHCFD